MARFARMRDFYKECWRRAWKGRLLHVEYISGLLALLAVPIAGIWHEDEKLLNWIPFALFLAVFMGTVAFGFLTAPFWIVKELEGKIDGLEHQHNDRHSQAEQSRKNLWTLHGQGVALLDQGPAVSLDSFVQEWWAQVELWDCSLLLEAEKLDTNLRNHLETLGTVPDHCKDYTLWPDHRKKINILTEKLERLQRYLSKDLH